MAGRSDKEQGCSYDGNSSSEKTVQGWFVANKRGCSCEPAGMEEWREDQALLKPSNRTR
jgi:hypothetical protein